MVQTFSKILCVALSAATAQAVLVRQEDAAAPQAIAAAPANIGEIVYEAAAAAARLEGASEEQAVAAGEAAKAVFAGDDSAGAAPAAGGDGSGDGGDGSGDGGDGSGEDAAPAQAEDGSGDGSDAETAAAESEDGSGNTGVSAGSAAAGIAAGGAAAGIVAASGDSAEGTEAADAEGEGSDASAETSENPASGGVVDGEEDEDSLSANASSEEDADASSEENEDDDSVCFPAAATVELQSGAVVKMSDVSVGDMVKVGVNKFSRVFMFTHKMADTTNAFVELKTASGAELSLTSGHYLYINGALGAAKTVKNGDELRLGNGDVTTVVSVDSAQRAGLFNPQTVSGNIVVSGVLASTYTTAVEPTFAHAILSPFRMLASLGLSFASLESGGGALADMAPRGQLLF